MERTGFLENKAAWCDAKALAATERKELKVKRAKGGRAARHLVLVSLLLLLPVSHPCYAQKQR